MAPPKENETKNETNKTTALPNENKQKCNKQELGPAERKIKQKMQQARLRPRRTKNHSKGPATPSNKTPKSQSHTIYRWSNQAKIRQVSIEAPNKRSRQITRWCNHLLFLGPTDGRFPLDPHTGPKQHSNSPHLGPKRHSYGIREIGTREKCAYIQRVPEKKGCTSKSRYVPSEPDESVKDTVRHHVYIVGR